MRFIQRYPSFVAKWVLVLSRSRADRFLGVVARAKSSGRGYRGRARGAVDLVGVDRFQ